MGLCLAKLHMGDAPSPMPVAPTAPASTTKAPTTTTTTTTTSTATATGPPATTGTAPTTATAKTNQVAAAPPEPPDAGHAPPHDDHVPDELLPPSRSHRGGLHDLGGSTRSLDGKSQGPPRLSRANTLKSTGGSSASLKRGTLVPTPSSSHLDTGAHPQRPYQKERSRHLSVRPQLDRRPSRQVDDLHKRPKKYANIGLDALLKDERARVGFFKFLEATTIENALKVGMEPPQTPTEQQATLRRRASKRTLTRMTVDYREDCVLFWLEISDLLKIPGGGNFQLGLMQDLFDVYIARGAPRLLPMVSAAERDPLIQFLQDRNQERALLAYKMLLLDVLEIVTAAFDEFVRCDGKLGYAHVTKNESMRNVLARLAKHNMGPASNDRRGQLNDIFNNPPVCRMFREFLQERNSVENLLFILDALAFEDLVNTFEKERDNADVPDDPSRHEFCLRQAQKIFNKYIRYGSKAEICLSAAVKETLLRDIVDYPISAQVFNEAVLLCSAELVHSHLDMFYRSHAYIQHHLSAAQTSHTTRSGQLSRRSSQQAANEESPNGRKKVELTEILNGIGVNYFRDFLREQGVENTLFFYKEVEQFQLLPHGQKHYIQSKARKIFDRYVRRGGKLEIELPMDVRRDILFKLSSPSEYTFVDALKYVMGIWEHKYLPKFRAHPIYEQMLPAIEASPQTTVTVMKPVEILTRRESATSGSPQPTSAAQGGDWVDINAITLREFLDLEFLRKYFRHFLEKEQCVNELLFYFEINNFQQLPTSDYLSRQARKLYNRFCEPQSRECVALRDEIRLELQQNLSSPRPAMFKKAQDEIFTFFHTTLFPKFQQSEVYRTIQMTHSQLRTAKKTAAGGDPAENTTPEARNGLLNFFGNNDNGAGKSDKNADGKNTQSGGAGSSSPGRSARGSVPTAPVLVEPLAEEAVTVTMILENQETRPLFLFFAEEIFCTESIYFWLDCNEYKDIPHRNYLKLRAQKIFRKYISGRAKLQVNLDSSIIKEIVKNLDDPARTLFIPAQKSITKMLERDTLPKFRKSKHFQPCLQILRSAGTRSG